MKKIDKEMPKIIAGYVGSILVVAAFAVYCNIAHVKDSTPAVLTLAGIVVISGIAGAILALAYWYEGWSIRRSNARWEKRYYASHPKEHSC